MGRIIAFDIGDKRVGVAMSDPPGAASKNVLAERVRKRPCRSVRVGEGELRREDSLRTSVEFRRVGKRTDDENPRIYRRA